MLNAIKLRAAITGTVMGVALSLSGAAWAADNVTLRINFQAWAMHAPYYAALKQGFYTKEGINLTIKPPTEGQSNEVFVGTGREQFGLSNVDGFLRGRAAGLPVVAIMADQADTPFAIISLDKANIKTPADLKGKKIALLQSSSTSMLTPVFKSGGLTPDQVNIMRVPRGAEVTMVVSGEADAFLGYKQSQTIQLETRGFPNSYLALSDYGVKLYGTLLFTNEDLIKSNPDLVKRFLRATLDGFIWTQTHQPEALAYIKEVTPDLPDQSKQLSIIYKMYNSPDFVGKRFGVMNDEKWDSSIEFLKADFTKMPIAKEVYTNQFLNEIEQSKTFLDKLKP